ncbi:hypothetical protein CBL_10009 [Carabus blaptoides fortunei]
MCPSLVSSHNRIQKFFALFLIAAEKFCGTLQALSFVFIGELLRDPPGGYLVLTEDLRQNRLFFGYCAPSRRFEPPLIPANSAAPTAAHFGRFPGPQKTDGTTSARFLRPYTSHRTLPLTGDECLSEKPFLYSKIE